MSSHGVFSQCILQTSAVSPPAPIPGSICTGLYWNSENYQRCLSLWPRLGCYLVVRSCIFWRWISQWRNKHTGSGAPKSFWGEEGQWWSAVLNGCTGNRVRHDVPQQAHISIHKFCENIRYKSWAGEKRNDFTAVTEHSQASCEWGICYSSSEAMARRSLAHSKSNHLCAFLGKCSVTTAFQLCCLSCIAGSASAGNFKGSSNTLTHTHKKPNKNKILKAPVRTEGKISGFTCPCYGFFYSFMANFSLWLASWNFFTATCQMARISIWVGSTALELS